MSAETFKIRTQQSPVTVSGTTAASSEIGEFIDLVRLISTTDCHINFDGAATTNHMLLAAYQAEYFTVTPGVTVNAIQASAGGTLYITEMVN